MIWDYIRVSDVKRFFTVNILNSQFSLDSRAFNHKMDRARTKD